MRNKELVILGVMSGTSLDGLDFALCKYYFNNDKYSCDVIKTGFYEYPEQIKMELIQAVHDSSFNFVRLHKRFGRVIGRQANIFLKDSIKPDFIASHGHTVFHRPDIKLTFQIGDAASIAAETSCSVISDFRNLDTALSGQGAPLVPIGDKLLFSEYDFCINLGGFANISFDRNNKRIAYDICPVNFILNAFSKELGSAFDKNGESGKHGMINTDLLNELKIIPYYSQEPPKSLGREYVEEYFDPIFKKYKIPVQDKMRTLYKHIATQICNSVSFDSGKRVLLTGGGAHNNFLVSEIMKLSKNEIIIPNKEIIDFKEAIIFGFLGFLRVLEKVNTLSSVTGSLTDSVGGSVFFFSNTGQK